MADAGESEVVWLGPLKVPILSNCSNLSSMQFWERKPRN